MLLDIKDSLPQPMWVKFVARLCAWLSIFGRVVSCLGRVVVLGRVVFVFRGVWFSRLGRVAFFVLLGLFGFSCLGHVVFVFGACGFRDWGVWCF